MNLRINLAPILTCVTQSMVVCPGTDITLALETWISNHITSSYSIPCKNSLGYTSNIIPGVIRADYHQMSMELDRALPASAMAILIRNCETCRVTVRGSILSLSSSPQDPI